MYVCVDNMYELGGGCVVVRKGEVVLHSDESRTLRASRITIIENNDNNDNDKDKDNNNNNNDNPYAILHFVISFLFNHRPPPRSAAGTAGVRRSA